MMVAVVTTSRADWAGLGMVAKALTAQGAKPWIVAARPWWGEAIAADCPGDRVTYLPSITPAEEWPAGLVEGWGKASAALTGLLQAKRPDWAVVLGDRHETLSLGFLLAFSGIPLAHIGGGDVTGGSLDERWRHALTKIADLHFPTNRQAEHRIHRMGENPYDVFMFGSPSVDRILATPILSRVEIGQNAPYFLLNWQPATPVDEGLPTVLDVLAELKVNVIAMTANADPGGAEVNARLEQCAGPRFTLMQNRPPQVYLSLLKHAVALVGNSSSGFYEAPYLGTRVINVGNRQEGRDRPGCVVDVAAGDYVGLRERLMEAMVVGGAPLPIERPYGSGESAKHIAAQILARTNYKPQKRWHE